jgi:histone deacetylase 8
MALFDRLESRDRSSNRHHTQKSSAAGFCYVADGVLAILALLRPLPILQSPSSAGSRHEPPASGPSKLHRPRVMYLDLDVHFGDGVAAAFHQRGRGKSGASSQVLTMSIHHSSPGFFPSNELAELPRLPQDRVLVQRRVAFVGVEDEDEEEEDSVEEESWDPYTLSVPLAVGTSSDTMARVWRTAVEPVRRAFAPHFLVLQCGADGLAGDPCSIWNWSSGGASSAMGDGPEEGSMGWCVQQACGWGCKVLLTGGGGKCLIHPADCVLTRSCHRVQHTERRQDVCILNLYSCQSSQIVVFFHRLTPSQLDKPLLRDQDIPDHAHFEAYAPSFTLDVPAGTMRDQNTESRLKEVETVFARIAMDVRSRRIDTEMQR